MRFTDNNGKALVPPAGFELVSSGQRQPGDMRWSHFDQRWSLVYSENMPEMIGDFAFPCARKIEEKITPRTPRHMTTDEWTAEFGAVFNHLGLSAGFVGFDEQNLEAGCLFETFGVESDYINSILRGEVAGMSALNVWTYMDGDCDIDPRDPEAEKLKAIGWVFDDQTDRWAHKDDVDMELDASFIGNGYHYVNRIGYFVTRKPADPNVDYVIYTEDALVTVYR